MNQPNQRKTIESKCLHTPAEILTVRYNSDNICHRCRISASNLVIDSYYSVDADDIYHVFLLEYCPACLGISIAEYHTRKAYRMLDVTDKIPMHFPAAVIYTEFDPHIAALSPSFVELYHQSETAEQRKCTDICGMGYRKALEFLVKDFLVHKSPHTQSETEKKPLGTAIQSIEDERIQSLAKAASWLGNDECHYVRKHTSHDVEDMKRFILVLVNFLVSELTFEEAKKFTTPERT